jgi:hypothetical protein
MHASMQEQIFRIAAFPSLAHPTSAALHLHIATV